MFFNPLTLVALLSVFSAASALIEFSHSSLPPVRRSLASKLERRSKKIWRQNNAQTSLTLDPSQIARGLAQDGQQNGTEPGQVPSLTSTNNFINFCLTQNVPLTNGQQVEGGSCNAVPMGRIIAQNKMPASKFVNPSNGATIPANTAFTIQMAVVNMVTGHFANANTNYYSAPQQVDRSGTVIGHSHVTVEALTSLDQTTPTDPTRFAFFKGLNAAAQGGILSADVTTGLPAGAYRLCSINSAANHQPVLVAVAQRGSVDDCVYFTAVGGGGSGGNGGNNNGGNSSQNKGGGTGNNAIVCNSGNAGNLQTFTGILGGAAPPVVASGSSFSVNGRTYSNKAGAVQRSCNIQKNSCANAANSSGNMAPLTVAQCGTQAQQCSAAISG